MTGEHDHDPWASHDGTGSMGQPDHDVLAHWHPTVSGNDTSHNAASGDVDGAAQAGIETAAAYFGWKTLARWRARRRARSLDAHTSDQDVDLSPAYTGRAIEQAERDVAEDAAERAALVGFCVELEGMLEREALREKVRRALGRVGVRPVDPLGEVFDPDRHEAVGSEPTGDLDCHDRVASVQRLGFLDRNGRELRLPEVVVWRYDAGVGLEGVDR